MQLFNQAPFAPLSGNIALDLAACVLGGMFMIRVVNNFCAHLRKIQEQRERTEEARLALEERAALVSTLHEELVGARGQAESAIGAYLQDVDNRGRVSAAAQERERDPQYSDLEDQLRKAARKTHAPFSR